MNSTPLGVRDMKLGSIPTSSIVLYFFHILIKAHGQTGVLYIPANQKSDCVPRLCKTQLEHTVGLKNKNVRLQICMLNEEYKYSKFCYLIPVCGQLRPTTITVYIYYYIVIIAWCKYLLVQSAYTEDISSHQCKCMGDVLQWSIKVVNLDCPVWGKLRSTIIMVYIYYYFVIAWSKISPAMVFQ